MLRNLTEQLSAQIRRATDFLQSKYMRRTLIAFSIVTLLVGFFVAVNPVHASGGVRDFANGMINAVSYILIEVGGLFIQITIFALKFFIEIAGYNNFIDASIVKLGWNMVRDIANMFFVVVLLVIAFGTILGLEQYEWKKTLVKLVMSAFLVNFSNLICQVIIDVAQVFTVTFLNALAGAAGGNLIQMFNLDQIYNIATRGTDPGSIQIELFGGAVMTVVFAAIAMFTIGAYLVVMIARMVVLWTLMILSPLAFLFAALPTTQSYAQEFWNQFTNQVIVAPVMVFFLWLAFATFGGGDVVQQDIEVNHPLIADGGIRPITDSTDANGNQLGISFSQAASWENMANFAVAIAFLWIGVERVQKLGVVGGGIVSGALQFGKNVATIASGVALGRWLTGKATSGVKAAAGGVGKGLYNGLLANRVEIVKNWGTKQIEGWGDWRARGLDPKLRDKYKSAGKLDQSTLSSIDVNTGPQDGQRGKNENGEIVMYNAERGGWFRADAREKDGFMREKKNGEVLNEFALDKNGGIEFEEDKRSAVQKFFHGRQQALIASRKNLEKVKNQKKVREDLMDKRVTAAPKYLMQKFEGKMPDAFDRMEQGMLEAEQMRSAAKTEEFKAVGKQLVLNSTRFKDGQLQPLDSGTVADQIAKHKENAARTENLVKQVQSKARRDYIRDKGKEVVQGKLRAELEVKSLDAESKSTEEALKTGVQRASQDVIDRAIQSDKEAHFEAEKQKEIEKSREQAYLKTEHGQAELRQEAALKEKTLAREAEIKEEEAKAGRDARVRDSVQEAIQQRIAAETSAGRAEADIKAADSKIARAYKEGDGREDIIATEAAKLALAGNEGKIKQVEAESKNAAKLTAQGVQGLADVAASTLQTTDAENKFKATQEEAALAAARAFGSVIESINLSEQAIAAAQGFTKQIKNEKLGVEFEKAAAKMRDIISAGGPNMVSKLEDLGTKDAYVRSMQAMAVGKRMDELVQISKTRSEEAAKGGFVEIPTYGEETPTAVLLPIGKRVAQDLANLEAPAAAKLSAKWIGHLFNKKRKGEKLSDDQTAVLFTAMQYMQAEGRNDDAFAEIVQTINDLSTPGKLQPNEVEQAEALKETFQSLGLLSGTAGKYTVKFGTNQAAKLQNIVALGGNQKALAQHAEIEARLKQNAEQVAADPSVAKLSYKEAIDEVLQGEADAFREALKAAQEFLQEGTSQFKRAALNTGHLQNGGHQRYDRELGMYRMATQAEAESEMAAEARKRKGKEQWQIHTVGDVNLENMRLQEVKEAYYRAMMSDVNSSLVAKNLNERFKASNAGYAAGETPEYHEGRGVIGGSQDRLTAEHGGDLVEYLDKVVKNAMLGQGEAYKLTLREFMPDSATTQEAESGLIRLELGDIQADRYSDLIMGVLNKLQTAGKVTTDQVAKLTALAESSRKKEDEYIKKYGKGGTGGTPAPKGGGGGGAGGGGGGGTPAPVGGGGGGTTPAPARRKVVARRSRAATPSTPPINVPPPDEEDDT